MPPTFHPESTHPPQHEPLPASVVAAALPESEHEFYARDVYRPGALPRAVVRPRSRDELRTLVVDAERLDDKSFGLDQALQQGQIARQDAGTIWSIARSIWSSSPNAATAATSLLRMAVAGTHGLAKAPYAAHYIVLGL